MYTLTKLIILRGNSGNGKTMAAQYLQQALSPASAMLVSQDVIRLGILNVKDYPGNPSIELIKSICEFGKDKYDYVILEGILGAAKYKTMLLELLSFFKNNAIVYYFDVSFPETLKRNDLRKESQRFSIKLLKKWWLDKNLLNLSDEYRLPENLGKKEIVQRILKDLK